MPIADNLARIRTEIAAACRAVNRAESGIELIAVTKTHPAAAVIEACAAGLRTFGENRVQEFSAKRLELDPAQIPGARFHLIGPLQSNKSARAAELFDSIDTVDSLKLVRRLNESAASLGKVLPVLIEIKLSHEESKHGLDPASPELTSILDAASDLPNVAIRGLMTVPPFTKDPTLARPYFRQLRELRTALAARYPAIPLTELSMGMSNDFAVAIEEGSTQIRIGTALFGAREYPVYNPALNGASTVSKHHCRS